MSTRSSDLPRIAPTFADQRYPQSKLEKNGHQQNHGPFTETAHIPGPSSTPMPERTLCSPYIVGDTSNNPIKFNAAENIIQAAGYAYSIGYPLNYHLTVNWPDNQDRCHFQLIRRLGEWQRNNIGGRAYIWAREIKEGPHSHILLHLPKEKSRKLRTLLTRWLKADLQLKTLPKGSLWLRHHWNLGEPFKHVKARVRYILKGSDPLTRQFLGIEKCEFGRVEGKRGGVSQELGQDARRKAGAVLPSGHRKPTHTMLEAAQLANARKWER